MTVNLRKISWYVNNIKVDNTCIKTIKPAKHLAVIVYEELNWEDQRNK